MGATGLFLTQLLVLLAAAAAVGYAGWHVRKKIKQRGFASPGQQMACGAGCLLMSAGSFFFIVASMSLSPWVLFLFPVFLIGVGFGFVLLLRRSQLANIESLYREHLQPRGKNALLVYHTGTLYTAALEKELLPELDEQWACVKIPPPPTMTDSMAIRAFYNDLGASEDPLKKMALLFMPPNAQICAAWFVALSEFPVIKRSELERTLTPAEVKGFQKRLRCREGDFHDDEPDDQAEPPVLDQHKLRDFIARVFQTGKPVDLEADAVE